MRKWKIIFKEFKEYLKCVSVKFESANGKKQKGNLQV